MDSPRICGVVQEMVQPIQGGNKVSANKEFRKKTRELQSIQNSLDSSRLSMEERMKLMREAQSILNWLDGGGWRK